MGERQTGRLSPYPGRSVRRINGSLDPPADLIASGDPNSFEAAAEALDQRIHALAAYVIPA